METRDRLGAQLKAGDTIRVWWKPGRDTITELKPYVGAYTGQPGWEGARIATFALCATGMTIFAGDEYAVCGPTARDLCDPAYQPGR